MNRPVTRTYQDPLDLIWTAAAARIGFQVERGSEVYASSDGCGTITLGSAETLDPDDCIAQMVLHELCHALVQGEAGVGQRDWGLCNRTDRDLWREHACLRVQAALAGSVGLRRFLAPTTGHRAFYDALPEDPLQGSGADIDAARSGLARAALPPFHPCLHQALHATAAVAGLVRPLLAGLPQATRSLYAADADEPSARTR